MAERKGKITIKTPTETPSYGPIATGIYRSPEQQRLDMIAQNEAVEAMRLDPPTRRVATTPHESVNPTF